MTDERAELDLSYWAGLIDGKGKITRTSQGPGKPRRLELTVSTTDARVVHALKERFGGAALHQSEGHYQWRISSARALGVIMKLKPYLQFLSAPD